MKIADSYQPTDKSHVMSAMSVRPSTQDQDQKSNPQNDISRKDTYHSYKSCKFNTSARNRDMNIYIHAAQAHKVSK